MWCDRFQGLIRHEAEIKQFCFHSVLICTFASKKHQNEKLAFLFFCFFVSAKRFLWHLKSKWQQRFFNLLMPLYLYCTCVLSQQSAADEFSCVLKGISTGEGSHPKSFCFLKKKKALAVWLVPRHRASTDSGTWVYVVSFNFPADQ